MKSDYLKLQELFNRVIPLLIWAMLVFFPILGAGFLFESAIKIEMDLHNAVLRQKLAIEVEKYNQELDLENYIGASLNKVALQKLSEAISNMEEIERFYRDHFFLSKLPDSSLKTNDQLSAMSRLYQRYIGSEPSFTYLIEKDEQKCGWLHNAPLKIHCSDEKFRKDLVMAHKFFSNRIEIEKENLRLKIDRKTQLLPIPPRIENVPEIKAAIGLTEALSSNFCWTSSRFSIKLKSIIVTLAIPILRENNEFAFVIFGSSLGSIDPFFMLDQINQRLSSEQFSHQHIFTGEEKALPYFQEQGERLVIYSKLPEPFNPFEIDMVLRGKQAPVLQISCKNAGFYAKRQRRNVHFALNFYALIMSFIMVGIYFEKINISNSMFKIVAAGFFAGILLPLSGAIWLGMAYLNTQKHLEAEALLDYMENKIRQKEHAIKLQSARNVLFQNIFSDLIAKLSKKEIENLYKKAGFFNPNNNNQEYRPDNDSLRRRLTAFTLIKPGMPDIIASNHFKHRRTETIQPFFSSRTKEVLFKLGAYKKFPEREIKTMLDSSQLTMGLLDQSVDKRLYISAFAENQAPIINTLSTGLNFLTGVFWRNDEKEVSGLSLFQFERRAWQHDLDEMIEDSRIQNVFSYNGYNIFVNFFELNAYSARKLQKQDISDKKLATDNLANSRLEKTDLSMSFLWDTAQALYSFTNEIRINNLSSANPHLISATEISDNQYFAFAYAVPARSQNRLNKETILLLLVFLAILSSMVLAWGIAWVLTRALKSFQKAIENLNQQNYTWQLDLKTGDEFDIMAESFNQMTLKLHEKEKISRLVSRNVLDAIQSEDEKTLTPGGSRVKAAILFCDIRNFTSITETHPPETVVEMLNEYFTGMSVCIENNGGIIDKLIGDAIQAVFYAHENDNCSLNALKTAIAMRAALKALNHSRINRNLFPVENGIGICTGMIVCGSVGSESGKLDATVIGSVVNQAAILESLSKHGNATKIAIDGTTAEATRKQSVTQKIVIDDNTQIIEVVQIRAT